MDAPDNFTLDRWLCRRCQWAIFTSLGRRDGILSVTFVCGYPDGRNALSSARATSGRLHARRRFTFTAIPTN